MQKKKPVKVISLFCGCGGADRGVVGGFNYLGKRFVTNPVEVIHASDINPKAIATYNTNFKEKALVKDITTLEFSAGQADVVIGGFPCQSFSTVNPTKNPDNMDTQLFWEMAKIVSQVKPKVFIAENVKGFYRLDNGKYFNMAKAAFEDHGYKVSHAVLNASDYGVPQLRERLFMVGVRLDIKNTHNFPSPTHGAGLKPKAVLGDVVQSLKHPNPKYFFSKRAVEGVKKAKPNMKRALAQDLKKQCLTITSHLAKASLNSRDPVLLVDPAKELYRRFSPQEAALIQSFPDNFIFAGSEGDAYRQIGNAIPPVVMWHVFRSVLSILN
jgi:DNA (cytosine-5)-methyltransferase 1